MTQCDPRNDAAADVTDAVETAGQVDTGGLDPSAAHRGHTPRAQRYGARCKEPGCNNFGWNDHVIGVLFGVAAFLVVGAVALIIGCATDAVLTGGGLSAFLLSMGWLPLVAVVAGATATGGGVGLGVPVSALLSRFLRRVRWDSVHVLVFAVVGLLLGWWVVPLVDGVVPFDFAPGSHSALMQYGLPAMIVSGAGRAFGMRSARRRDRVCDRA